MAFLRGGTIVLGSVSVSVAEGLTESQLGGLRLEDCKDIVLRADPANAGNVRVGWKRDFSAGSCDIGLLQKSEALSFSGVNVSIYEVFLLAASPGDKLNVTLLT